MANLTITAGAISSQITASNAKATQVVQNMARLHGYTGDIDDLQAVLDFIMPEIRRWLTGQSKQYQQVIDVDQAVADNQADTTNEFED